MKVQETLVKAKKWKHASNYLHSLQQNARIKKRLRGFWTFAGSKNQGTEDNFELYMLSYGTFFSMFIWFFHLLFWSKFTKHFYKSFCKIAVKLLTFLLNCKILAQSIRSRWLPTPRKNVRACVKPALDHIGPTYYDVIILAIPEHVLIYARNNFKEISTWRRMRRWTKMSTGVLTLH